MPPLSRDELIAQKSVLARDVAAARRAERAAAWNVEQIKITIEDLQNRLPVAEAELEAAQALIVEREAAFRSFEHAQSHEAQLQAAREKQADNLRQLQERKALAQRKAAEARQEELAAEQALAALTAEMAKGTD